MATTIIGGPLKVLGPLVVTEGITGLTRQNLRQEDLTSFGIQLTAWRAVDLAVNLPAAASGASLGLVTGATYGTNTPTVQTGDVKNMTSSRKMSALVCLPQNYVAGQSVRLRFHAGMLAPLPSGAATIDCQAYKSDSEGGVDSSDLVTTNAVDIKSTTLAYRDFELNGTGLEPGDELHVLVTVAVADVATSSPVIGVIGKTTLLCDTQG